MADLCEYLTTEFGVCTEEMILLHLLWADDLILVSDTIEGLQAQLDGLLNFCADNLMIVNYIKTKVMAFGNVPQFIVRFNGRLIERVEFYKYLGNVFSEIKKSNGDVFSLNYDFLCDKGRSAMFSILKRTRSIGKLPPTVMFELFDSLIMPILTYGSDIWGHSKSGTIAADRIFLRFIRCVLMVKATTSNAAVYGECGRLPPSVSCHVNILTYANRLHNMGNGKVVKQVYNELCRLHEMGFATWVTKVSELVQYYKVDVQTADSKIFKQQCKMSVKHSFEQTWQQDLVNSTKLRTYTLIKDSFCKEPYLDLITDIRYRRALTKIRTSSHTLEIERGRYTRPKTPVHARLCHECKEIDDEIHFLIHCKLNNTERTKLFEKVSYSIPVFATLNSMDKFICLLRSSDAAVLKSLGKFIHRSFLSRNT